MRFWIQCLVVAVTVFSVQTSYAQDGTPPQEAPFIQDDTEFDVFPESQNGWTEEQDALILEDNNPLVQEPVAPIPVTEVQPVPKVRASNKTRRSAKGGVEYIEHPQAANGLVKITKDGSYIYRVRENTGYTRSGAFRFGTMDPPKIASADGTTFSSMYSGAPQPLLMFDFEWQPFQRYGKLGVQGGFGFSIANGKGRFLSSDTTINGQEAKEKYTFITIPLSLGVAYRLEWMNRQWIAPYISGGGTYIGVAEIRDDGKDPKLVGTPAVYGGGGMLFNVSAMNRDTAFTLSSEYGINNLWVSIDYRYLKSFNEDLDFSSSIIGGGVVVDY